MSENPSNRKGARHIDTRINVIDAHFEHFVDQLVQECIMKLVQCKTKDSSKGTDEELSGTGF
jgi:hypothetical protein